MYEVLYYDGDGAVPAYFLVGGVEGDSPEQALAENINSLTTQIIDEFELEDDASTRRRIQGTLYVLRPNGLVSLYTLGG